MVPGDTVNLRPLLTTLVTLLVSTLPTSLWAEPKEDAPPLTFQQARELVARSYEKPTGPIKPIEIHWPVQPPKPKEGWLSWFGSGNVGTNKIGAPVDVIARKKSGDEIVIDRLEGSEASLPPHL
jgi:hypothetical protein